MKQHLNSMILYSFPIIVSFLFISGEIQSQELTKPQKKDFIRFARNIGSQTIGYAESWVPPGEKKAWIMDCSNTVRYIYQENFAFQLPRTAYDQYNFSKKRNSFREAPIRVDGKIDSDALRKDLHTGDILFWENTYTVPHNPPISHVMVYLGKNKSNRMKMFGAGTFGKGEQTLSGGLDVYIFDPNQNIGCAKNDRGECTQQSRFLGYARILKE
jgi:hypothetical protein